VLCAVAAALAQAQTQPHEEDRSPSNEDGNTTSNGETVLCEDANIFGVVSCEDLHSYGWCTSEGEVEKDENAGGDDWQSSDHVFFMKSHCAATCGFCETHPNTQPTTSVPQITGPAPDTSTPSTTSTVSKTHQYITTKTERITPQTTVSKKGGTQKTTRGPATGPTSTSTITTKMVITTQLGVRTANADTTTTTTTKTSVVPSGAILDTTSSAGDGTATELGANQHDVSVAQDDVGQEIAAWKLALGVAGCVLTGVLLVMIGSGVIKKRKRKQESSDGFGKALCDDGDFNEDTSSIGSSIQSMPLKTIKVDLSDMQRASFMPHITATTAISSKESMATEVLFAPQDGYVQQSHFQGQACQMPQVNAVEPSIVAESMMVATKALSSTNPPSTANPPSAAPQAAVFTIDQPQPSQQSQQQQPPPPQAVQVRPPAATTAAAAAAAAAAMYPGLANPAIQSMFAIQPPHANMDIQRNQWATLLSTANAAIPRGWHMAMHPQQLAHASWKAQATAAAAAAQAVQQQQQQQQQQAVAAAAAAVVAAPPAAPPAAPVAAVPTSASAGGAADSATQYARGFEDAMRLAAVQHQQQLLAQQAQAQVQQQQQLSPTMQQKQQVATKGPYNTPIPQAAPVVVAPPAAVGATSLNAAVVVESSARTSVSVPAPTISAAPVVAPTLCESPPIPSTAKPTAASRLLRVDDVWQNWALVLGAKDRNDLIRRYGLTKLEAEDLKKTSRRMKQNMAQQRYLRRQQTVEEMQEDALKASGEFIQPQSPTSSDGAPPLAAPASPTNSVSSTSSSSSAGVDSILEAARMVSEEEPDAAGTLVSLSKTGSTSL